MGFLVRKGKNWMYRYNVTRASDGKRVENMRTVCLISGFPSEKKAWEEVKRKKLDLLEGGTPTFFGTLIEHFKMHELDKSSKAKGTISRDKHNLDAYVVPRWGTKFPQEIRPLEVEAWLKTLTHLSNPSIAKVKTVMGQVFKSAQRHGLLSRDEGANPMLFVRCATTSDYEAVVLTPEQTFKLLEELEQPEYTLALLIACTGLRQSEALALQWGDLDFEQHAIHVRRSWVLSETGKGKTNLAKSDMPMHSILAEAMQEWRRETLYHRDADWIFASYKMGGKIPRCGSVAAADYLRPAAVKAGVLNFEETGLDEAGKVKGIYRDSRGEVVTKFGWHNLRHSLSSFLVSSGTDPKTVQSLLRHSNIKTTLDVYAHANSDNKMAAQGEYLEALAAARDKKTAESVEPRRFTEAL
jgi:integrase